VQSAIQIKSDKNNFTCIKCAEKGDTQCDCYSLLSTVSKSGMRSSFNIAVML